MAARLFSRIGRGVQGIRIRHRLQRHQGGNPFLRAELDGRSQGRNIRVNVVSPGPIQTPGFDVFAITRCGLHEVDRPVGRLGTADEIAKTVLFLASGDSSFIAGVELFVDGGSVSV